jgi:hypothetical protein
MERCSTIIRKTLSKIQKIFLFMLPIVALIQYHIYLVFWIIATSTESVIFKLFDRYHTTMINMLMYMPLVVLGVILLVLLVYMVFDGLPTSGTLEIMYIMYAIISITVLVFSSIMYIIITRRYLQLLWLKEYCDASGFISIGIYGSMIGFIVIAQMIKSGLKPVSPYQIQL